MKKEIQLYCVIILYAIMKTVIQVFSILSTLFLLVNVGVIEAFSSREVKCLGK